MFVITSTVLIMLGLGAATWELNFVGSDEENLYLPATHQIAHVNYISELTHSFAFDNPQLLHGKEVSIWFFSLMQRLLHDTQSLRPLLLTVIAAWALSAVLVFLTAAFYWGQRAGLICYVIFISSFWPYVYVLLVKHQPVGLCLFLAAVFVVQKSGAKRAGMVSFAASGILMAAALHASTVATLYLPLYFAAVYYQCRQFELGWRHVLGACAGAGAMVCYLNYPHVIGGIREFLGYVNASRNINHFAFHQNILRTDLHTPGGWVWVLKYLWLAMPVVFLVYVFAVLYTVIRRQSTVERRETVLMGILSLSPIVLAYASGVAQYGGNYFPCFVGVLTFIGYICRHPEAGRLKGLIRTVLLIHIAVNAFIFFTDVFPSRMASVYLSKTLRTLGVAEISVHADNLLNKYTIGKIQPNLRVQIKAIETIAQANRGYIVVAPVVGSSIYLAMTNRFSDFDQDIYLNELLRRGTLEKYAVASFKAMASSPIWRQEEETLSYRDLVLGQFAGENERKSKLWVLDAERLSADRQKNLPSEDYVHMVKDGVRNAGTKSNLYLYKGVIMHFNGPVRFSQANMRLYKVGNPHDELVMYVYKHDVLGNALAWLPWTKNYASQPISAAVLLNDQAGQVVPFNFVPALELTRGDYHFVIYRTGKDSNEDFYRVYIDESERTKYLNLTAGL